MARIEFTKFREGQAPNAADMNAPYNSLASVSIDKDNTKPNWATRKHFDDTGEQANELFFYDNDTSGGWNTTSTSYSTVSVGGSAAEIAFGAGVVTNAGDLIRLQTSGIIGDVLCATDGDGDGSQDSYNYFSFRLLLTFSTGGGSSTTTVAECGYSFTRRSRLTNDSTGLDSPLWWRNFSFSGVYRVPSDATTLTKVELQGKVGPNGGAGNRLDVTRHNITAVVVRN
tara:strand:- start:7172 stop:7852 length:681 start_codon:yes stop_codon:yes gene_type:complete